MAHNSPLTVVRGCLERYALARGLTLSQLFERYGHAEPRTEEDSRVLDPDYALHPRHLGALAGYEPPSLRRPGGSRPETRLVCTALPTPGSSAGPLEAGNDRTHSGASQAPVMGGKRSVEASSGAAHAGTSSRILDAPILLLRPVGRHTPTGHGKELGKIERLVAEVGAIKSKKKFGDAAGGGEAYEVLGQRSFPKDGDIWLRQRTTPNGGVED